MTWMKEYSIPKEMVLPHSSINSVTRAKCPGPYYTQVINALP